MKKLVFPLYFYADVYELKTGIYCMVTQEDTNIFITGIFYQYFILLFILYI